MFNVLFLLLSPYLPKLRYWSGAKRTNTYSNVKRKTVTKPKSKILSHQDHILKRILPISMLNHVYDIVKTCAALCKLKPLRLNSK